MKGFKEFLLKNQVLALAVAVIMGGAIGKVISSLVADILMPLFSPLIPGGEWRTARIILNRSVTPDGKEVINAINYGNFMGTVIDFVVIAFCVYIITKALIKEVKPAPTKACPLCTETIPAAARKCKYCTADLANVSPAFDQAV